MNASRDLVPFSSADISTFCKTLRAQLLANGAEQAPSHLALLNMIAKSAGHKNYQALRAAAAAPRTVALQPAAAEPAPIPLPTDPNLSATVKRAITHFDTAGRLIRFPTQLGVRLVALWGLWVRLPVKRDMTEAEVNGYIAKFHTFADNATLRRELVNARLLWRTKDGSVYRRMAVQPEGDAAALLKVVLAANL